MDSDDEIGIDSGNVSSEEEDNYFMEEDAIQRSTTNQNDQLEYPFEVLTTEEIVQHMLDVIKEVTSVVEVSLMRCNEQLRDQDSKINLCL